MIIAISGKKQSGKSTIARIIQYYTAKEPWQVSIEEYLATSWLHNSPNNNWEVKMFAGKLKEIVSLLTGISVQDLEKEEVKQRKLPAEWTCWKLSFTAEHNDIDHLVWKLFSTEDEARTYIDENYIVGGTLTEYLPTYREVLQTLGTELFRNHLNPNVWIISLFKDITPHYNKVNNIIISDLRFVEELKAVQDRNGLCIRVTRPKTDKLAGDHLSETALDGRQDWDWVFDNSKDLNHLVDQVKAFVKFYKL